MFHGNMDDDQEPLTVKKQYVVRTICVYRYMLSILFRTKTSKVTKSQKQQ